MYIPKAFEIKDNSMAMEIMSRWNFADLVTCHNGALTSNKLPFLLDRETKSLYGHMGRSNPQLQHLEQCDALVVVFSGPHSYISPQWYVSDNMVPTWNYQTVQVKGTASFIDDDILLQTLSDLSNLHESGFPKPWSIQQLDPDKLNAMLNAIQGFKIEISQIQHKEKMSQNRSLQDQQSVVSALEQQNDPASTQVASIMRTKLLNKRGESG